MEKIKSFGDFLNENKDPNYLEWLTNNFKKNKEFVKIMKDSKLSNEEYKTIYYAIQDAISSSRSVSNPGHGW